MNAMLDLDAILQQTDTLLGWPHCDLDNEEIPLLAESIHAMAAEIERLRELCCDLALGVPSDDPASAEARAYIDEYRERDAGRERGEE